MRTSWLSPLFSLTVGGKNDRIARDKAVIGRSTPIFRTREEPDGARLRRRWREGAREPRGGNAPPVPRRYRERRAYQPGTNSGGTTDILFALSRKPAQGVFYALGQAKASPLWGEAGSRRLTDEGFPLSRAPSSGPLGHLPPSGGKV